MTIKLLLAEDDANLQEVVVEALSSEGFEVTAFNNAEDALACATDNHFDLALFDVVMPGITGIEALGTLKRLQPNIGIIITTAFATVDVAVDAMKRGADEFLTKPFDLASVSITLKRVHAIKSPSLSKEQRHDDLIFSALANPIRRSVLKQLKLHRKMKFMDLCRLVGIADHTKFNFHLRQLINCGLVHKEQAKVYSLTELGVQVYAGMLNH